MNPFYKTNLFNGNTNEDLSNEEADNIAGDARIREKHEGFRSRAPPAVEYKSHVEQNDNAVLTEHTIHTLNPDKVDNKLEEQPEVTVKNQDVYI